MDLYGVGFVVNLARKRKKSYKFAAIVGGGAVTIGG